MKLLRPFWLFAVLVLAAPQLWAAPSRLPNVILILSDDQGYGDVGVYGARGLETPILDRMAREGIRFTSFYSPGNACSPTRAAILTGSYPLRVGMRDVLHPRSLIGLNPDEVTLPELLKERGYVTAAVGKWHLGDHPEFLPNNHGFDSYFGLPYSNDMSPDPEHNPHAMAVRNPPLPLLRNPTVVEREPDQSLLTRRYTEEAVRVIEDNADRPFFLYVAHSMPHVPLYASEPFRGSSARGLYGDVIQEIDWSVGQILDTLQRLNLDQHTLVVFTSDNGPWLSFGNHGGSAGPLREGKSTAFEGGLRVPGIARWPGRIPAGQVSDEVVTAMDLLPTVARLAGAEVPRDRVIDGEDIWPILSGRPGAVSPHDAFYYYFLGELQAVRSGRWKLHVPHSYLSMQGSVAGENGRPGKYHRARIGLALYDLDNDIGESTNVAEQYPDVVRRLQGYIESARSDLGDDITGTVALNARAPGRVDAPWEEQLHAGHQPSGTLLSSQ